MNESIYYIPLLFPQSGPLLCIGLCCGAEVERSFGKAPGRPTAVVNNLAGVSSSLRGSSLLTSFSEATFPFLVLSKGFSLWSAMGLPEPEPLQTFSNWPLCCCCVVTGVRYYGLYYSTFSKCRAANRESLAMSPFLSSIL